MLQNNRIVGNVAMAAALAYYAGRILVNKSVQEVIHRYHTLRRIPDELIEEDTSFPRYVKINPGH